MNIEHVIMTRLSYQSGLNKCRMLVLHATAGRSPSDFEWLKHGGGIVSGHDVPVSIHYYIAKNGHITQFLNDTVIAWHAGISSWIVDGYQIRAIAPSKVPTCNPVAIGIELENLNTGHDPYPPAQYTAAVDLARALVAKHHIPRSQLVRHMDIAPGRKFDPCGFSWKPFVERVYQ